MTAIQFETFMNKDIHKLLAPIYTEVEVRAKDVYFDEFKEEQDIQRVLDKEFGTNSVKVTSLGGRTLYIPHTSNSCYDTHIWSNDSSIDEEDINVFLKTDTSDQRFELIADGIRHCSRGLCRLDWHTTGEGLELAILEKMKQEGAEYYHLDIFGDYIPYGELPEEFEDADGNRIMVVYGFELEYVGEEETRAMLPTTL